MIGPSRQIYSRPFTAFFQRSPILRSSGSAKPGWHVSKQQRWGPEISDNQYFSEHPTYTGFVLWIRGIRPYLEKLIGDSYNTAFYLVVNCVINPLKNVIVRHNPDIRLQFVAFVSFYLTVQSINIIFNRYYQKLMDLKHLRSLELASTLQNEGFFLSESEDLDQRIQNYSVDHERLNALWEASLIEATEVDDPEQGFQCLCKRLAIGDVERHPATVPAPMTWRMNMIPFGAGNADSTAFPVPSYEEPHRAFALNFTYNNLGYNWGDYIDRRDNKSAPMRPSRQMFADVYLPPTK